MGRVSGEIAGICLPLVSFRSYLSVASSAVAAVDVFVAAAAPLLLLAYTRHGGGGGRRWQQDRSRPH